MIELWFEGRAKFARPWRYDGCIVPHIDRTITSQNSTTWESSTLWFFVCLCGKLKASIPNFN